MLFRDRADAGGRLAAYVRLLSHANVVVFGLPRGGVPVAFEVARSHRDRVTVLARGCDSADLARGGR